MKHYLDLLGETKTNGIVIKNNLLKEDSYRGRAYVTNE